MVCIYWTAELHGLSSSPAVLELEEAEMGEVAVAENAGGNGFELSAVAWKAYK